MQENREIINLLENFFREPLSILIKIHNNGNSKYRKDFDSTFLLYLVIKRNDYITCVRSIYRLYIIWPS